MSGGGAAVPFVSFSALLFLQLAKWVCCGRSAYYSCFDCNCCAGAIFHATEKLKKWCDIKIMRVIKNYCDTHHDSAFGATRFSPVRPGSWPDGIIMLQMCKNPYWNICWRWGPSEGTTDTTGGHTQLVAFELNESWCVVLGIHIFTTSLQRQCYANGTHNK